MNRLIKFMAALLVVAIGCAGCRGATENMPDTNNTPNTNIMQNDDGSPKTNGENGGSATIEINEEIMDYFFVEATMEIPNTTTYRTYRTSLKEFTPDEVIAALLPNAERSEMQIEHIGDFTRIVSGEAEISFSAGYLTCRTNQEMLYMDEIFGYAYSNDQLVSKEIEALSSEDAISQAEATLSRLGMGVGLAAPEVHAFSKEDLAVVYDYLMENDSHFAAMQTGKNRPKNTFGEEDEMYRIRYTFELDAVLVFSASDPPIYSMGGVDAPSTAWPMDALVYVAADGVRSVELMGVVDELSLFEEREIILWDGIKEALVKKYGDIILTEELKVIDISLEYTPVMDLMVYGPITLAPVWRCEFWVDEIEGWTGPKPRMADRFHAFTVGQP